MRLPLLATAAVLLAAAPVQAHVVAVPAEARAGSYAAVAFRVGHACSAGDVTTALRVEIPEGVESARAQPKPGWDVRVERGTAGGRPDAVTWTGRLTDDAFEDFNLLMKLPKTGETLVFPIVQTCDHGESQWIETADPAQPDHTLSRPAPVLRLIPAAPAAAHQH